MAINNQISIPFVVLIGATVSNIIDRIIYGGVLDYISVPLIPLFNISDMFIVVASFWILISIVCNKSE
jgi:signal peptidase II